MGGAQRIDEILSLLERFALGEASLSKRQVKVALKLLDLMIDDEPPDDDGYEAPVVTDDQAVLIYPRIAA
jgi:hypothetical protein